MDDIQREIIDDPKMSDVLIPASINRYLLFYGDKYYPNGGWNDFQDSYNTIDEAKSQFYEAYNKDTLERRWGHIFDTVSDTIIKL